jgi:hypothetical protein
MGIATIPIYARSKKPAVRWQRYQATLPTEAELLRWFRPGRMTNAAVICGWQGLVVLDFDTHADYIAWEAWAASEGGLARQVMLQSYRVRTSRGMHVYVMADDCPRCGRFKFGDVKGRGGYVLIPPSVHPSGHVYQAMDDEAAIMQVSRLGDVAPEVPLAPLPPVVPLQHVVPSSALWPATLVERIKAATPILSFFPDAMATGGQRWYVAHCPWHDDKHESLWIDAERGICGCYVGCTPKPLDAIGVYGRLHGLDNRQAVREMAKAGILATEEEA